ncbi:hypothetical protein P261_01560 [Lachnospiraceae bacterium TWA4]|nr:hypothetical protein P261_01560 [Lachnospiraceae bacterium TWA4]
MEREWMKNKNVQISYELFLKLVKFHMLGIEDYGDEIVVELEKKMEAVIRREIYTKYKSALTENEREKARNEYLDRCGIPKGFRW